MAKNEKMVVFLRVGGILITVLGIIHCAFTPLLLQGELASLSTMSTNVLLFMYLGTGMSVILAGAILLLLSPEYKSGRKWVKKPLYAVIIYLLFLSIIAVFYMKDNPFAYTMLGLALFTLIPIVNFSTDK